MAAEHDHHDEVEELDGQTEERLERRRQALSHVLKIGDPVLKSVASPVAEFDHALREEAGRLIAVMRDGMGVGLAATQLGILRRLLVFAAGMDAEPRALVNPEIQWLSDDVILAEEGCLSIPGITLDVERPVYARIHAQDESGEELTIEASGLEARVIQHEMDHLDGVLILDRAPREQRREALRALRAGESYSPPSEVDDEEPESASAPA